MDKISDYDFFRDTNLLIQYYDDLLGYDVRDVRNIGHPIYEKYQELCRLTSNPKVYQREKLYSHFSFLESLKRVKLHSEADFLFYKDRLAKNKYDTTYYGNKFEAFIYFTLLEKDILFRKTESPDFTIMSNENEIYIECGSTMYDHLKAVKKANPFVKIRKGLNKKSNKSYVNGRTLLFYDITNIKFYQPTIKIEDLHYLVKKSCPDVSKDYYGSVVFFNFCFDLSLDTYAWQINSIRHKNCAQEIIEFMQTNGFPDFTTENRLFPIVA